MTSVLVSGAEGQLGRALRAIQPANPEIDAVFLNRTQLDICRPEQVRKAIATHHPEYFVNCAAYTNVEAAEDFPKLAMEINGIAVGEIAKLCQEFGVILIQPSTDYVFDGEKKEGYLPYDPPNPINAYGQSKLAGEMAIRKHLENFFIIRTSWLYSSEFGPNFYTTVRDRAINGVPLQITDAQQGRPTRAENLAAYIYGLIKGEDTDYGIRHYTDGRTMNWYEFAVAILAEEGLTHKAQLERVGFYPTKAKRPKSSVLL